VVIALRSEAMIFVLCSPVGPYFKSGFVPIKLSVDAKYIRAWPGGTGNVKFGGNYAPTVASIVQVGTPPGACEGPCGRQLSLRVAYVNN
jgi:branched-subunit amino acid aminotransferase/4-amino-4-deoxychorismate lyase